jgi:hypothetical protein
MMFMDKILDLDLDYFVWPIAHNRAEEHGRPPGDFDCCRQLTRNFR